MLIGLLNAMFKFIRRLLAPAFPADFPACELPAVLNVSAARRVLVFAPHPDDEVLGCGGTLALLAAHCAVRVVLVTDGSGGGALPAEIGPRRRAEWVQSLALLGIEDVAFMDLPDGQVWPEAQTQRQISQAVQAFAPDWVFAPGMTDYHRDHMAIAQMVHLACLDAHSVQCVLSYEIWAPVWATHVVDITAVVGRKRAALLAQSTSLQYGNYLQAIEGLNVYRGLYLSRPDAAAEAFAVQDMAKPKGQLACRPFWLRWLRFVGV
jgi:LmbE family N-acetylglucosaminyl deacetylase